METELYLDYNTVIHRLDPRTKLILFLYAFIGLVLYEHPLWMLPIALLILLQTALARAWINLWRLRYLLLLLTTWSLVLWNLFVGGDTPLFLFVSKESLLYSIARTMLVLLMIIAGVNLISTTRNEELVLGLIKFGLPYRVGFALSTSLRLVPTTADSLQTIAQAQRSRGLDLESGNVIERLRKWLPLLIPVFITTIRSTNIFGMALESKGFGARPQRTFYLQTKMHTLDWILLIVGGIITLVALYLNFRGYGSIPGLHRF